jgi:hypothetical protein
MCYEYDRLQSTPVLHAQETFTQESFEDFHEALLTSV